MKICKAFLSSLMVVALVLILCTSASAAEKGPDDWKFTFLLYGWLPSIDASATFKNIPPPSGGGTIGSSISASELVKKLNFVFRVKHFLLNNVLILVRAILITQLKDIGL